MRLMRLMPVLLLVFVMPSAAHASKIVKLSKSNKFVVVTHRLSLPWRKKENVCLFRNTTEIACGTVVKAGKKVAVVKIKKLNEKPALGDTVHRASYKSWLSKKAVEAPKELTELDAKMDKKAEPKAEKQVEKASAKESTKKKGKEKTAKSVAKLAKPVKKKEEPPPVPMEVPEALADLDAELPVVEKKPEPEPEPEPINNSVLKPAPKTVVELEAEPRAKPPRQVATSQTVETRATGKRKYGLAMTFGGSAGFNHFFPTFGLQYAFNRLLGMGGFAFVTNGSSGGATLSATGFYVTGNLYLGQEKYEGPWVQLGIGGTSFSVSTTTNSRESSFRMTFSGLAGWRFRLSQTVNLGVAFGTQYIGDPQLTLISIGYKGIQPTAMIDVGLVF